MTVPDASAVGAIVGVTGFCGYLVKRIADSYFTHIATQTVILDRIVNDQRNHSDFTVSAQVLNTEAHRQQAEILRDVSATLTRLNGKRGGK